MADPHLDERFTIFTPATTGSMMGIPAISAKPGACENDDFRPIVRDNCFT
jgi:hypothetical protein